MHAQMPSNDRISVIDAFRGFALAGIVLTHMVEHYIAAMPPPDLAASFAPGPIDQIVQGLIFILITGKFFALFSFLFGLSFFIQMDRAAKKDFDFRVRFIWRLVILLLIGYLHSLFYRGDILTIYAILGFLLVFFYNVRSSLLLAMDLFNFSLSVVLLCTFVLIFSRPKGGKVLEKLAPYGRMALTNYFMQTIIGTFILYHWGLGLMTKLPNSQTLLIALGIITAQVILSSWWLSRFRYGPLEWLWRSATYLAWQPLRR